MLNTKEIIFSSPIKELIDPPKPSLLTIPDSYKNLSKRIDGDDPTARTVKACIPFLDALTIGYIISFPVDFVFTVKEIKNENGEINHEVRGFFRGDMPPEFNKFIEIQTHSEDQMPPSLRSKFRTLDVIFKILSPWHIKTPPGYSCIFTNPFNRNTPFEIIDGVVDTDDYPLTINFPAFWTENPSEKETLVKKGTPLALVIPFKREQWKMKTEKKRINTLEDKFKFASIFMDNYKKLFWKKKSFK